MKHQDIVKIILHEYKYEKSEWLVSVILQWLIFSCVFFLLTISCDLENVFSKYLSPMYPDGYIFSLDGYTESDVSDLENMGFHDVYISDDGDYGSVVTDKLNGIWLNKFKAVLSGKDIWNEEMDEILGFIFFARFTFFSICFFMFVIMLNNLSNSFTMKIIRRKKYIQMLGQLGCANITRKKIFYWLFGSRSLLAFVVAVFTNMNLMHLLNIYIAKNMGIQITFTNLPFLFFVGMGVITMMMIWLSFGKQWRKIDEN